MKPNSPDSFNTIGSICKTPHTVGPDEPVHNIKKIFDTNTPISAVVVTQDSTISGLVMNIHLNLILSHQYGFSLFYKKLVSEIMDTHPMIVDAAQSIDQVAQTAMKRENLRLYDHIIVTKNNLLFGIVAVRTITECPCRIPESACRYPEAIYSQAGTGRCSTANCDSGIAGIKKNALTGD
ncbi:MAG: CBS domain-containing protein [Pseudomonadota bacterium]